MRIELKNETAFREDDLRALLRRCLKAVGYNTKSVHSLKFEVVSPHTRGVSGVATIGRSPRYPAAWIKVRIPSRDRWSDDTWRRIVAVTVHECQHLVGAQHKDMTEAQYECTLPLPAWAHGLHLRLKEAIPQPPREERKAAARAENLEHAQAMLKRATTRVKRATTIERKWQRRVKALSR